MVFHNQPGKGAANFRRAAQLRQRASRDWCSLGPGPDLPE